MIRSIRPFPAWSLFLAAAAVQCSLGGCSSAEPGMGSDAAAAPLQAVAAHSDYGMVATGSPEATRAAVEILERGGNAVDAAVAAAIMLSVADTDGSGLGGMTYLVLHLADGRDLVIDGSPPAPVGVVPAELLALELEGRLFGHKTVAVPTTPAVLELARSRYGTLPMAELIAPAIGVAEQGYLLSPIQITWTHRYMEQLLASTYLRFVAMEDGRTVGRPGDRLCRPALAATLRRLAARGIADFYRGGVADTIERDMIAHGGFLRKPDLAALRVRERPALRTTYRAFDVLSFPPPGGGCRVTGALNVLEHFPSSLLATDSVERLNLLVEAFRIANAGDAALSAVLPNGSHALDGCIDATEAAALARLIEIGRVIPPERLESGGDPRCAKFGESTTQISVIDQYGNVVSLTQTLGRSYGAAVMAPELGFPYNDFLETFNFSHPDCPNYLRPRIVLPTPMAPTIVLRDGILVAALGSGASNRIPHIITGTISNLVDRGMDLPSAVAAPRILWGGTVEQEPRVLMEIAGPLSEADADALLGLGYPTLDRVRFPADALALARMGSINAVGSDPVRGGFVGVGDPRRSGVALGPRVIAERHGPQ
ncbi:MAG TPA: gamma-glutamyltransferase [Chondromyces sp.]|nr:gamma-glutamyltransferase [Chondromyces sp.]